MAFRYVFMQRVRRGYTFLDMQTGRQEIVGKWPIPWNYYFELEEGTRPMAPQMRFTGCGWQWTPFPAPGDIITNGVQAFTVEDINRHEMTISRGPLRVTTIIGIGPLFLQRVPVLQHYNNGWQYWF